MTQINIPRLLENTRSRMNVYTPLIESIVNSIHAIEQKKCNDGTVIVTLRRSKQGTVGFEDDAIPDIVEVEIVDNGIGFTDENRDSFDTIFSNFKIGQGGKGFGRFSFLKYFTKVSIDSVYQKDDKFYRRSFDFVPGEGNIILNEVNEIAEEQKTGTKLTLSSIKKYQEGKIGKKVETISRKILENLLVLFADDDYDCPKIVIRDEDGQAETLNDYIDKHKEIEVFASADFTLTKDRVSEVFKVKVFKVFYSMSNNSIRLAAHNREVTDTPLQLHIPEFADQFYDELDKGSGEKVNKNYVIKVYVTGKYLDENVSLERNTFEFSRDGEQIFSGAFPFTQRDIEAEAVKYAKTIFDSEVKIREEKKVKRVQDYVQNEAPWHKPFLEDLDYSKIPFKGSDQDIEIELHNARFTQEKETMDGVRDVLEGNTDLAETVQALVSKVSMMNKSDLAHYVALRRAVLDLFKKSLGITDNGKHELEKVVHTIVFPMGKDSEDTTYDQHNLWILDERLSFNEYLASDKQLAGDKDRPDIMIFNKRIAVRGGEETSNPIVVFEFKRPQRDEYEDGDDPIKQIGSYVKKIRQGKVTSPKNRPLDVNDSTPAYGFVVCDLTPKIREFCLANQLDGTPDGKGYYGYHKGYGIYFEILSFDKLVKDAELRNRIFFKKLGIV